jgi:hypothetical protein
MARAASRDRSVAHERTVHAASAALVNESAHFESECVEHDLHAFFAIRTMDEILVNNFMVSTIWSATGTTTSASATKHGTSTIFCTSTQTRSRRLSYDFPGYVSGFVPPTESERAHLRE